MQSTTNSVQAHTEYSVNISANYFNYWQWLMLLDYLLLFHQGKQTVLKRSQSCENLGCQAMIALFHRGSIRKKLLRISYIQKQEEVITGGSVFLICEAKAIIQKTHKACSAFSRVGLDLNGGSQRGKCLLGVRKTLQH